jgi:lipoprotein NlpD
VTFLCAALTAVSLGGCASKAPAPVIERGAAPAKGAAAHCERRQAWRIPHSEKGETLYSIALEHGQSYRDVAAWNNIDNPNMIRVGQQLRVAPPEGVAVVRPIAAPPRWKYARSPPRRPQCRIPIRSSESRRAASSLITEQAHGGGAEGKRARSPTPPAAARPGPSPGRRRPLPADELNWAWPAAGRVISGPMSMAAARASISGAGSASRCCGRSGKVTYAGSGIRGYGNLVIVQHANSLISVYAHNSKLLVKENQQVAKGQRVAELGNSDADQAKLHFEIRRQGKPHRSAQGCCRRGRPCATSLSRMKGSSPNRPRLSRRRLPSRISSTMSPSSI